MGENRGDCWGQNNLGYLYETGPEGIKDLAEASRWYARAAVSGNPTSQYNLGLRYLRGGGVKKSPEDAAYWFRRAADANYPPALVALGCLYATGAGVPQDLAQPHNLTRKTPQQR